MTNSFPLDRAVEIRLDLVQTKANTNTSISTSSYEDQIKRRKFQKGKNELKKEGERSSSVL